MLIQVSFKKQHPARAPPVHTPLFYRTSSLLPFRLSFSKESSTPPPVLLRPPQNGSAAQARPLGTRGLFSVSLPLLPGIPVSAFSWLFGSPTSQALRAQGFTDVISLRCADTRRWRKEQLRRPSLLLLGSYSSGVMAPSLWKGLVGIGLFALAHAAFSAAQHRSYMRLTEKEDESLPIDIVLQTLLAFAVTCYGIVHIAGEFKDMDATSELKNKTFDTLRNHPSFYVFNHRGRVLFRPSDTTNSSNQDALSSNTSLKLRKLESLRR
ncbi:ER membrane protein complex subunit 5 [Physeter macrocephalus]|uniref:ER membrane protein complex subunit 5 n=1 Tax=Physeter macrocephalus TaxID=9755 RepID=A0A2Y9EDA2_PHYMC|nr:ER membrane protein complex subunit 5 [Physeter catodon]|eukprot:XP_007100328.1 membrane magnesium transporter 1 [Physeter catodon]